MSLEAKSFSNLITFTRASNATYFDSTGVLKRASSNVPRIDYNPLTLALRGMLIEEQRTNLLTYSEDFNNAAWSKTGTIFANQTNAPDGALSADLLTASASTFSGLLRANPNPTITSATTYTLSVYVKKNNWRYVGLRFNTSTFGATEQVPFYDFDTDTVSNGGVTAATITRTLVGNGWVRIALTFTSTSTTGTTDIWLTNSAGATQPAKSGTESVFVWGAQLEAGAFPTSYIPSSVTFSGRTSIGTYYDSTGLVRKASSGASRLSYNPTNLNYDPFLLLEESRTNLLTYSEDFNNAAWAKSQCTIVPNATVAPSGALSADKFVESTTASAYHLLYANMALTTGTTYTMSVYAKDAGREIIFGVGPLVLGTGIYAFGRFNLSNGTSSAFLGSPIMSMTNVGNGWYRCAVTFTSAVTATVQSWELQTLDESGNNGYTGNGTSGVFIWGAQLEVGAFATSYMPSTVTFSGRTSDGTYFDSSGELITAGSGVSRTTYNPANLSADPFLLLEESRTNSIRNNTMAGAVEGVPGTLPTNWVRSTSPTNGISSEIIRVSTESGINYLDVRFIGTATSTFSLSITTDTSSAIAASSSQVWTNSSYFKLVAGSLNNSTVQLVVNEYSSVPAFLRNSFSSTITPTITGLSLQRTSQIITTGASTAYVQQAFAINFVNGSTYDFTLRIGMPQLEQGAGATSVIATSSAAVTRSADTSTSASATRSADTSTSATATRGTDIAYIDVTLQPWFKPTEGTLYAECIIDNSSLSSGYRYPGLASLDNNTVSFCIHLFLLINSSLSQKQFGAEIFNNGSFEYSQINGTIVDGAVTKLAVAYKENDSNFAFQGTLGTLDTSVTLPNNISRLRVGANRGTTPLSGWIRRIAYYPTRLTNAQLQTLTT
jgi:hypothetical protein